MAQLESARLANEAKLKAQVEAQKKAAEQQSQLAQFESARLANEAKIEAQLETQKKIKEQEIKATQSETDRRTNESKAKIQEALHRTPQGRVPDLPLWGG